VAIKYVSSQVLYFSETKFVQGASGNKYRLQPLSLGSQHKTGYKAYGKAFLFMQASIIRHRVKATEIASEMGFRL
jgi:hypothetical protein